MGEFRVVAYNASKAPAEENKSKNARQGGLGGGYPNARSELWFEFAEDWLPQLDLDDDEDLLADLCAPEYKIDSQGRRVVEPKEDTKKRLGRSPDRADSVMLMFLSPDPRRHEREGTVRPCNSGRVEVVRDGRG